MFWEVFELPFYSMHVFHIQEECFSSEITLSIDENCTEIRKVVWKV